MSGRHKDTDADPAPDQDLPPDPETETDPSPPLPAQRPAGPLEGDLPPPDNVELLALIISATKIEVVFSDGEAEITALSALHVSAAQFNPTAAGLKLTAGTIEVVGPAEGVVVIAGYALYLDDVQVAWAPRAVPLQLPAGRRLNLTDDVVFPG